MPSTSLNRSLHAARAIKQDEFYTQLSDIEKELVHYKKHFRNKTVFCNCDDPRISNFFKYFLNNFEALKLKKLITTCYRNDKPDLFSQHKSDRGVYFEYSGEQRESRLPDPGKIKPHQLKGDGDFRSEECVNLLKQADIVITNPPFSLFREYVGQLIEFRKNFLILGQQNVITYKEIYALIQDNKLWLGANNGGTKWFEVNKDYDITTESRKKIENGRKYFSMGSVNWFTNLDLAKRHDELITFEKYNPKMHPKYDNYDAIEVSRYKEIPIDYYGAMGVPITFLDKHNPDQFQLLGQTDRDGSSGFRTKIYTRDEVANANDLNRAAVIKEGKSYRAVYMRIIIKRKK